MENQIDNHQLEEERKQFLEKSIKNSKVLSATSGITASLATVTLLMDVLINKPTGAIAMSGYAIYLSCISRYFYKSGEFSKKELEKLKETLESKKDTNAPTEIKEQLYTMRDYIEKIKFYRNNNLISALGMTLATVGNLTQAFITQDSTLKLAYTSFLIISALMLMENLKTAIRNQKIIHFHQTLLESFEEPFQEEDLEEEGPKLTHKPNKEQYSK